MRKRLNVNPVIWGLVLGLMWLGCGSVDSASPTGRMEGAISGDTVADIAQRVTALYSWYVPQAIPRWPRTVFDAAGPHLDGKRAYLDLLQESGYFSEMFIDSLAAEFDRCEAQGREAGESDHLACEEADALCFYFPEKLDGVEVADVQLQGARSTVSVEVHGSGIAPAGVTYHESARMRLGMRLEGSAWRVISSAYEN